MDNELEALVHEFNLGHYKDKLAGLGLHKIRDVHHLEEADLNEIGMRKIQLRAFKRMCQAACIELKKSLPISHTVPRNQITKTGPAPPAHPPPAELLAHRVPKVILPNVNSRKIMLSLIESDLDLSGEGTISMQS